LTLTVILYANFRIWTGSSRTQNSSHCGTAIYVPVRSFHRSQTDVSNVEDVQAILGNNKCREAKLEVYVRSVGYNAICEKYSTFKN